MIPSLPQDAWTNSGIARSYEKLAAQARRDRCGYEEFLQSLLQEELQNRKVSRVRTLLKSARFPLLKQLDTFEFDEILLSTDKW